MTQTPYIPDVAFYLRKAVQETIQVGLMMTDPLSGNIFYANNKLCELFGYSAEELLSMNFSRLLCEGEDMDIWKHDAHGSVIKFRSRDGSVIWGLMSSNRLYDEKGNEQGVFYSISDITRRKIVEHQLQLSQKKLGQLTKKLLDAQEEERKRIAQELHDGIGSNVNAVRLMLEKRIAEAGNKDFDFSGIVDMLKTISDDTRRISHNLHPSMVEDIGLVPALKSIIKEYNSLQSDIVFHPAISIDENKIPDSVKLNIYRILQESLNNIIKHSGAATVDIECHLNDGQLELSISDDGCGFDSDKILYNADLDMTGLGMESMKKRAKFCDGTLTIDSDIGRGTRICVKIPV